MIKLCENIINSLSIVFFGKRKSEREKEQNVEYTLSSVFPTKSIMNEAKKYI